MRAITLAALTLLVATAPTSGRAQGDFHWTGRLAAGKRLEIKGVNGDIHVTAASGNEIAVTGVKHARRSDPASVEIKVVPSEDGVTICAVYPTPRRAERENSCEPGEHWHSNTQDNDVTVDFTVKLPAGLHLDAHTVNGEVGAEGLGGDVHAYTVNGSIRISTTGTGEATTVNGSIEARLGKATWDQAEFRTVNGGITLDLPANLSTEVRAETLNGDLISDFPLVVSGRFGPRRMRGTIGQGGRTLELGTVNGTIRLRKGT